MKFLCVYLVQTPIPVGQLENEVARKAKHGFDKAKRKQNILSNIQGVWNNAGEGWKKEEILIAREPRLSRSRESVNLDN